MKINYFKVIPVFLIEAIKIAPIIIKYGKIIWNEISDMYNKEKIEQLDKQIVKAMEEGIYNE